MCVSLGVYGFFFNSEETMGLYDQVENKHKYTVQHFNHGQTYPELFWCS